MEEMTTTLREVVAHQFAEDWLLVVENDYKAYQELISDAKELDRVSLSDKLREEWETLAEQVVEVVEEKISPMASLLIAQIIQGQGSLPFDLIADRAKELIEEVTA